MHVDIKCTSSKTNVIPVIKNKTVKNITWNLTIEITRYLNRLKGIEF